jgi:hypothetical protein
MDKLCYNKRNGAVGRVGMNTTLTIQEKLKDLRVEHGLTLEQLATRPGFPNLRSANTRMMIIRT